MARFTVHCSQLSTKIVHEQALPLEQFWLCDRVYEQMPQGHLATSRNTLEHLACRSESSLAGYLGVFYDVNKAREDKTASLAPACRFLEELAAFQNPRDAKALWPDPSR